MKVIIALFLFFHFIVLFMYPNLPVSSNSFVKHLSIDIFPCYWTYCSISPLGSFLLELFLFLRVGLPSCCPETCLYHHPRKSLTLATVHLIASNRTLELTLAQTVRVYLISHYRNSQGKVGFSSSSFQFSRLWLQPFLLHHQATGKTGCSSYGHHIQNWQCPKEEKKSAFPVTLRKKGTFFRCPLATLHCPILFSELNHMLILEPVLRSEKSRDDWSA